MTTKEQERKALAQIKKIVEGLGEDSYIAAAFEGCFEDAELNIENDAAFSMKTRADMLEKDLKEAEARLEASRNEQEALKRKLEAKDKTIENLTKEAARTTESLSKALEEAEKKILPDEAKSEIIHYLGHRGADLEKIMVDLSDLIVDMVDTPEDIAFTSAVKSYKEAREERKQIKRMARNLLKTNG